MMAHAAEFFTLDEVNRLKIIQDLVDRRLTIQLAAQRRGISYRQCRCLKSSYRESCPLRTQYYPRALYRLWADAGV